MTTARAKASFGIELWLVPDGGSLVKVAELITLNPPPISRGTIDATTHDSSGGAMEKIAQGVYEVGAITGQIHYEPDSTQDDALVLAMTGGALQDFKIVFPTGSPRKNLTGSGYLTEYAPQDAPVDGRLVANLTLTPTGAITVGAEAS
jgi:predicted secreted protein